MKYKVITAVATEPVTRTEAKVHLRVDSTADDTLIDGLITAAREFAEHYTNRALAEQTLEMALDCFPDDEDDTIKLSRPPVTSITSIKYTDTAGTEQTIANTAYALSAYGDSRTVAPTFGNYWPSTQDIPDAVRIRYVCGVTAPKAAKSAILLLIGHLYENRETVNIGNIASELPLSTRSLLDTVKVYG